MEAISSLKFGPILFREVSSTQKNIWHMQEQPLGLGYSAIGACDRLRYVEEGLGLLLERARFWSSIGCPTKALPNQATNCSLSIGTD